MEPRLDFYSIAPDAAKIIMDFEKYMMKTNIESSLYELVKVRASQLNRCAFCLDMHTKDARANGETEQRCVSIHM